MKLEGSIFGQDRATNLLKNDQSLCGEGSKEASLLFLAIQTYAVNVEPLRGGKQLVASAEL